MPRSNIIAPRGNVVTPRGNATNRQASSGRQFVDGGGGGATDDMTFLEEISLNSTQAFSAISGAYRHLQCFYVCGSDQSDAQVLSIRFNGDTGANYDNENVVWQSGDTTTAATGQTSLRIGSISGSGDPAGTMTAGSFYIPYYATTTQDKSAICTSEYIQTGPVPTMRYDSGTWRTANAAITSITFVVGAGSFAANSKASLYGIT